ncbi:MAG: phosphopentomutase, partial [Nitrospirota bacterium]
PIASYGKMAEISKGKDSTTGHWEITGVILDTPFPVYPNGFPEEVIEPFKKAIRKNILGNIPTSGTEIIKELGEEHVSTGYPIVYTSADSVFQIAAHEDIIGVDKLYEICKTARNILRYPHNVSRVIARPFTGRRGSFIRTERRKDFSLEPLYDTILDRLNENHVRVIGIGKIEDLFAGRGITTALHTTNNMDVVDKIIISMEEAEDGLIFANLVDFDMLYGHRNDPYGFANALKDFDERLSQVLSLLKDEDILIITADHGNDPTTPGTDHSREYVPLLVYGKKIRQGIDLGVRESFSDVGQTIADIFGISPLANGKSLL